MEKEVKDSIIDVIKKIIKAISNRDVVYLRRLSNFSIHNASIFQDDDSISIAVVTYSIAKIIERNKYKETKEWTIIFSNFIKKLTKAKMFLIKEEYKSYKIILRDLFKEIARVDNRLKLYIEKVIEKGKIKKGSLIYEHGISLERAAELLGVSQWELMNYVGKTRIADEIYIKEDLRKRLSFTRSLFNLK